MNPNDELAESHSNDPVLREMARMATRILHDKSLTTSSRGELMLRLESEFHAYKAWSKQYASYFRTPRPHQNDAEHRITPKTQRSGTR